MPLPFPCRQDKNSNHLIPVLFLALSSLYLPRTYAQNLNEAPFVEPQLIGNKLIDERWGTSIRKAMDSSSRYDNLQVAKSIYFSLKKPELPISVIPEMCLVINELVDRNPEAYLYQIESLERIASMIPDSSAWALEKMAQVKKDRMKAKMEERDALLPEIGDLHLRLGNIYARHHVYSTAIKHFKMAKDFIEEATVSRQQGLDDLIDHAKYMMQLDSVRERLKKKLKDDPEHAITHQNLAEMEAVNFNRPVHALRVHGKYIAGTDLEKYLKLMVQPKDKISLSDTVKLADWFRNLSLKDKNSTNVLKLSNDYYQLYFSRANDKHAAYRSTKLASSMVEAILKGRRVVHFDLDPMAMKFKGEGVDPLAGSPPNAIRGEWSREGRVHVATHPQTGFYTFPVNIKGSFRLDMMVELEDASNLLAVTVPVDGRQVSLLFNARDPRKRFISGIAKVDNQTAPKNGSIKLQNVRFAKGRHHLMLVVYTHTNGHARIDAFLDGRSLLAWRGQASRLGTIPPLSAQPTDALAIGLPSSPVNTKFHAMRLISIDGRIRTDGSSDGHTPPDPDTPSDTGAELIAVKTNLDENFIKTKGKFTGLIKMMDSPKKYAAFGRWTPSSGGLISKGGAWEMVHMPVKVGKTGYILSSDIATGINAATVFSLPLPGTHDRANVLIGPVSRLLTRNHDDNAMAVRNIKSRRIIRLAVIPESSEKLRIQAEVNDELILNWHGKIDELDSKGIFDTLHFDAIAIGSMSSITKIQKASLLTLSKSRLDPLYPKNALSVGNLLDGLSETKATLQGRWNSSLASFETVDDKPSQIKLPPELRSDYQLNIYAERLTDASTIRITFPVGVIHRQFIVNREGAGFLDESGALAGTVVDELDGPIRIFMDVEQDDQKFQLTAFVNGKEVSKLKHDIKPGAFDPAWSAPPPRQVVLGGINGVVFYGAHIQANRKKNR